MEFGRGGFGAGDAPRSAELFSAEFRRRRAEAEAAALREAERRRVEAAEAAEAKRLEADRLRAEAVRLEAVRLEAERKEAEAERRREEAERSKLKARPVELSAGRPEIGAAVTVERVKFDSRKSEVRIIDSRGIQVGDNNRQENTYAFEVKSPQVSVEGLLDGDPTRLRAFEKLLEKPRSAIANAAFRRTLRDGPLYEGGDIKIRQKIGIKTQRVAVHHDSAGALVIDRSQGIQLCDESTQRNLFKYTLEDPKLSVEAAVRKDPKLARALVMAVGHHDSPAAQRSLERQLQAAFRFDGELIQGQPPESYGETIKIAVTGDGVQLGRGNKRLDKITVHTERLRLADWECIAEREHREADYRVRDQRVCAIRRERIAGSRSRGRTAADIGQPSIESVSPLVRRAAAVVLDRMAPGREYLAEKVAARFMLALDDMQRLDVRDAVRLKQAFKAENEESLPVGGGRAEQRPELDLVELGDATSVVMWGSAAAITGAVGARALNAEVVLRYVRQRIWDKLHDGNPPSVAAALRALRSLQIVIFLESSLRGGLWLDIEPVSQVVAATLSIRMDLSAGRLGSFEIFTY